MEWVGGPLGGELDGALPSGTGYRREKASFTQGGTIDEDEETVVGRPRLVAEGHTQHVVVVHLRGIEVRRRHRAIAHYHAGVADAIGTVAVFVELLECAVGVKLPTARLPVEPYEVGRLQVGRKLRHLRKGVAVGLLRLRARVGHLFGTPPLVGPPVPRTVNHISELAARYRSFYSCHVFVVYCFILSLAPIHFPPQRYTNSKHHPTPLLPQWYIRGTSGEPRWYNRVGIDLV